MATVITVHGTFSSGPEEGSQWWQLGGPFEADLKAYVRAADGSLKIRPFVWDGQNSESSRRKAAQKLLDLVLELENKGEPYCLVGHSHGGSVIAHMLSLASIAGQRLPSLSLWSTVGSPFIVLKSNALLISRLFPFEKLILFSALVGGILSYLLLSARSGWAEPRFDQLIACLFPGALAYLFIWWKDMRRLAYSRQWNLLAVAHAFAHNSLCVYHSDDEAINSLTSVPKVKLSIFDRRFLSGIALWFVIAVTPIVFIISFLVVAYVLSKMLGIASNEASSFSEYMSLGIRVADYVGGRFTDPILFPLLGPTWGYNIQLALLVLAFVIICFGMFIIVGWLTAILSGLLARRLNVMATFHVAQAAYGADTIGLTGESSSFSAFNGAGISHMLPNKVGEAIRETADVAASKTISDLRRKISLLISSIGQHDVSSASDNVLTWNELIHTTYFKVPEFRALLCIAIARAKGFTASDLLMRDTSVANVENWLTSIQERTIAPALSVRPKTC